MSNCVSQTREARTPAREPVRPGRGGAAALAAAGARPHFVEARRRVVVAREVRVGRVSVLVDVHCDTVAELLGEGGNRRTGSPCTRHHGADHGSREPGPRERHVWVEELRSRSNLHGSIDNLCVLKKSSANQLPMPQTCNTGYAECCSLREESRVQKVMATATRGAGPQHRRRPHRLSRSPGWLSTELFGKG